jgi:hypothetical protein
VLRPLTRVGAVSLITLSLAGCDVWEKASITISYVSVAGSEEYRLNSGTRKRTEEVFRQISERNGYKCHAHVKRVEEISCRGPRDLHLVFQPTLNKPQFVAEFSWVDLSGRTHAEFMGHVEKFRSQLSSALGEDNVRLEAGR